MPSSTDLLAISERLHDGPQQSVTAVRLLADAARTALAAGDTDTAGKAIARITATADEAAGQLRDEVARLRAAAGA